MECLWLSFFVLILGVFIILFAKPEYKTKLFSIFLITGWGTAMIPAVISIMNGSCLDIKLPYILFSQGIELKTDPFSAFMTSFVSIISILFGLKILFTKKDMYRNDVLLLSLFSSIFLIFAVNVQNGVHFYLAISIMSLLLLTFIGILGEKTMFKTLLIYLSGICATLTILISGILSKGVQYTDMVNTFVNNNGCSYLVFSLIFIGFAVPVILSDILVSSDKLKGFNCSESLFLWFLFLSLYFYGFLRFIGMGAVPSPLCQLVCVGLLVLYIGLNMYKLINTQDVTKAFSCAKTVHIVYSIMALFVGVNGYITNNFSILILGYLASFLFLVNTVLCSYAQQISLARASLTNNNPSKIIAAIAAGSFAGIPATLGFWAWISLIAALISGFLSEFLYVKILFGFIMLISITVFFIQICKLLQIFKKSENVFSEKFSFGFDSIISSIIVLFGLFFSGVFKVFVVPVSFFAGGTQFYDLFQSIGKIVGVLNNCILFLVVLTAGLFLAKILISKSSEKIR